MEEGAANTKTLELRVKFDRLQVSPRSLQLGYTAYTQIEEMEMNMQDLKKLSKTDRLLAMDVIWDSLLYEDADIASPDWHENIIEERKTKIANGTAKFISISELTSSRGK